MFNTNYIMPSPPPFSVCLLSVCLSVCLDATPMKLLHIISTTIPPRPGIARGGCVVSQRVPLRIYITHSGFRLNFNTRSPDRWLRWRGTLGNPAECQFHDLRPQPGCRNDAFAAVAGARHLQAVAPVADARRSLPVERCRRRGAFAAVAAAAAAAVA